MNCGMLKRSHDLPVEFKLENVDGSLRVMTGQQLVAPSEKLAETSVLIELSPGKLQGQSTPLVIGVYSNGRRLETVKTSFVGPRADQIVP